MKNNILFFNTIMIAIIIIITAAAALAETPNYYIDYENGSDSNPGTKSAPWKHHPWDPEAVGIAKAHTGICNYYFKKGVIYRGGSLTVKESGIVGSPIVLGVDSDWGAGKAQIYGSERITGGWTKCGQADCPEILAEYRDKVWYVDTAFDYVYIPMMLYEIRDSQLIKLNIARSPNWNIPIPESPQDYALDDPKTVWWEFSGYAFQSKLTLDSVSGFNLGDQVYKQGYTSGWEKGIIKISEIGADYIKIAAEQTAKEDFFSADQITNGTVTHTVNAVSRLPTRYRDNINLTQTEPDFWKDGIIWYEDYCFWPRAARIQSYDPDNHEIQFYGIRDQYINKNFYRYFVEGLPQLLEAENEWCYIRSGEHKGRIYLRLEGDRDPNTTVIEKAKYHTFLNIEEQNNIIVDGLEIKFFNARDFYTDPPDYPYYPRFTNDGVRSRAAEYYSPVIRITRNSSNISVVNCDIEYGNVGIAVFPDGKDKLLDNIKINHNRIAHMESNAIVTLLGENFGEIQWLWDWWPIKPDKPFSVLNSRIKHVQIKNNQIEDIGLRAQSWNPNGAIGLYDIETSEVAYNVVDYTAAPGININSPGDYWQEKGYTGGSDKMDYPLQRNLIHHNQVSRACLMGEDVGGIEIWHAGPNYVYCNISGNNTGSRYPYKKQNPARKDNYRISAFAPGIYLDNSYKNYVFNNILWGKNNNENDFIYNSVGFNQCSSTMNYVFNNTIYNCAVGMHKDGQLDNRDYFLNNLFINIGEGYINDEVYQGIHEMGSVVFGGNIFNDYLNSGRRDVFGKLNNVIKNILNDFINQLILNNSMVLDPGREIKNIPIVEDAPAHNFMPLETSASIDNAKKVFVPWGLYEVAGEWGFYKYRDNINRILDEHMNWNKYWSRPADVYNGSVPRRDLTAYNVEENNFHEGILEDWIEGALELNGQNQYLGLPAGECGLLDMDKDADGNQKINNFLIEAVLRIPGNETNGGIVEKSDGSKGYTLAVVNGYLKMTVRFGASDCSRTSTGRLNDAKWHHIIAEVDRCDQEGINIYVDGKLCNGAFTGIIDFSSNISNSGDFIAGYSIDEGYLAAAFDFLRISRGTLAQAETTIEELYDWEFNGPFLKDFYDNPASGDVRDTGAIEYYMPLPITGDINEDGKINVTDVQLCVNIVLGIIEDLEKKADIDGDDFVTVIDLQMIVNALLKG
ncbi:MAG: dockerin type I domain-containing protein [Candidatus Omnitrophota bacterium]